MDIIRDLLEKETDIREIIDIDEENDEIDIASKASLQIFNFIK